MASTKKAATAMASITMATATAMVIVMAMVMANTAATAMWEKATIRMMTQKRSQEKEEKRIKNNT